MLIPKQFCPDVTQSQNIFRILLTIFPPWIAYEYATVDDNYIYKGFGDPSFIGFHFILSSQHEVLGEAPYMVAEINYKLWGIFYLILVLIGFLMILFLWVIKIYGSKKSR